MKIKIISILVFLSTLFITDNLSAQESVNTEQKYPETVLIKLVETTYSGASVQAESKLIIVKQDNSVETKLLERASYLKDADSFLTYNLTKIRTELQLWQNKGFQVQAMSSASPMDYIIITTFILTKN